MGNGNCKTTVDSEKESESPIKIWVSEVLVVGNVAAKREPRLNNLLSVLDRCDPQCQNGGQCIGPGRCQCPTGYVGPQCQEGRQAFYSCCQETTHARFF